MRKKIDQKEVATHLWIALALLENPISAAAAAGLNCDLSFAKAYVKGVATARLKFALAALGEPINVLTIGPITFPPGLLANQGMPE